MPQPRNWSTAKKNNAVMITMAITISVEIIVSRRVGHVTFDVSARTCCRNVNGFVLDAIYCPRIYGA